MVIAITFISGSDKLAASSRDTLDEQFPLWRGVELLRPSYMFAIQVSSVTVITKNTNAMPIFFVCLLVRCYRIDALPLPLPLVRFAPNCGFKNRFLPCVTNPLVNTRAGRRVAQAALNLCDSLEQRRDLGICLSFISLNAELVASRTSTPLGSRSHENRRRLDGDLLRGVEWRAGVHLRLSRRLSPRQEEAIMVQIRSETDGP